MTYRVAVRDPQGAKGEPENVATTMRADDPLVVDSPSEAPTAGRGHRARTSAVAVLPR